MDSLIKAFYHVRMAEEYFADVIRDVDKGSMLASMCREYIKKCKYIENSFRQTPAMQGVDLTVLQNELNGDILVHEEISRLCLRLAQEQKESVVTLLKSLIAGEKITVEVQ